MNGNEKKPKPGRKAWRGAVRFVLFLALAMLIGSALNGLSSALEQDTSPAGFGRGLVQGALMPMAFPNLLVGRDINIYAARNTGVRYKLGYTAGVNVCGAIFFGVFFRRLQRLRRAANATAGG